MSLVSYGDEIKALRKQYKLLQRDLAFLAGKSMRTIQRWESKTNYQYGTVIFISSVLSVEFKEKK